MEHHKVVPIMTMVKAFEQIYDLVFLMEERNGQFFYVYVSPNAKELASLGEDCIGKTLFDVYPRYFSEHLHSKYEEALRTRHPVVFKDKMNSESFYEVGKTIVIPIICANQQPRYFIGYTEVMKYKDSTAYDSLTGLPSFHLLREQLQVRIQIESERPLAFCYLNIRHFKYYIDLIGHAFVDQLILEMTRRIQDGLAHTKSLLARITGDEFVFFLDGEENGSSVAKKVQKQLSMPYQINGIEFSLHTVIGMAYAAQEGERVDNLINQAYHAMFQAKQIDGNEIRIFNLDAHSREIIHKPNLERELRRAIGNNELTIYFQPIIHTRTGEIRYEALLRWFSAKLGPVSPEVFIATAEESGYIQEIDRWVIENACREMGIMHQRLKRVSINLSTKTLESSELEYVLCSACARYDINPNQIELELTEHTLLRDEEELIVKLGRLREIGFRLAIDDFGMSHASFNYLRVLPVDKIKIDKAFIQNIVYDSREFHIVSSILSLAKKIGVDVTAEGVETTEQALLMMEAGCDELQGYYFSKPAPNDILLKMSEKTKKQWLELVELNKV